MALRSVTSIINMGNRAHVHSNTIIVDMIAPTQRESSRQYTHYLHRLKVALAALKYVIGPVLGNAPWSRYLDAITGMKAAVSERQLAIGHSS
jgi:hypothetical protein